MNQLKKYIYLQHILCILQKSLTTNVFTNIKITYVLTEVGINDEVLMYVITNNIEGILTTL